MKTRPGAWKTGSPGPSLHPHWLVLYRITPKTFPVSQCRPRDDSRSQYDTPTCLIPCNRTEYIIIALLKTGIPKPLQVEKVRKKQTDHHGGIRHPCSVPTAFNNKNSASIRKQKCLCGSCGIQHHMPRDLGGVLPTCALGNRQTDLSTGWDLQETVNWFQPLLAVVWELLENMDFSNHL